MDDLFFYAAKLMHVLVEPDSLIVLCLAAGTVLLWLRPRLGRWLVSVSVAVLLIVSLFPFGLWLLKPLEDRFPRPDLTTLAPPAGIVVLGGSVQPVIAEARGVLALKEYGERIAEMVMLARRFPNARIVHSGGSADFRRQAPTEASAVEPYLAPLGIDPARVLLESDSRNTYEDAVYSYRAIQPKPDERWLLVTSASHMPRSVGVFRGVGWDVLPFPVDFRTSGRERWPTFSPAHHWRDLRLAAHEYIGLLSYYLAGHSPSLFPGPKEDDI